MGDVILGLASGYSAGVYRRFLMSLRKGGYSGRVVLFMQAEPQSDVREVLDEFDAETEVFGEAKYQLLCYRFLLYEKWIAENMGWQPGRVLLTDVNDVVFQGDVFRFPMPVKSEVYFFAESKNIGDCPFNSSWIRHYYGDTVLSMMAKLPVVCAGTTFGTSRGVREYVRAMNNQIWTCIHSGKSIECGEQGIHNFTAHMTHVPGYSTCVVENVGGPVYTIGSLLQWLDDKGNVVKSGLNPLTDDGWIMDTEGNVPPLVHQFNRMEEYQIRAFCDARGWPTDGLLDPGVGGHGCVVPGSDIKEVSVMGEIRIVTGKPVAVESLDHLVPFGTARDNSVNPIFNQKLFALAPPASVRLLDIGCAGGGLVRSILEAGGFAVGVEGSDYSKKLRRAEWATIPDHLFTADATDPFVLLEDCPNGGFAPIRFNVVTAWEFFEHIEEDSLAVVIKNMLLHLSQNGVIIASIHTSTSFNNGVEYHRTIRDEGWWVERFTRFNLVRVPELERHFDPHWVRGGRLESPFQFPIILSRRGEVPCLLR